MTERCLRLSVLQMSPPTSRSRLEARGEALRTGLRFCRRALSDNPQIILFPETWNLGFADEGLPLPERLALMDAVAVADENDEFVAEHRAFARRHGVAIALGVLRKVRGRFRDSLLVIGGDGEVKLAYDKVHTCDFDFEAVFEPGDAFPTAPLETAVGPVQVGCMICYDREFPESARLLMLQGAELVLTANCCVLDDKRIHQFQARAFENAAAMAMANYSAPLNGRSTIVDADGEFIVLGGGNEGVVTGEISLIRIREYRDRCGWGNAFRRPARYGALSQETDIACFRRLNFHGEPFPRPTR